MALNLGYELLSTTDCASKADRFFKRLFVWTVVCCVSAIPSFVWALEGQYNVGAMICGVSIFILAYTISTSTDWFDLVYRRPFVRTTMRIGYWTRMILSLAYPIGAFADVWPGLVSISIVRNLYLAFGATSSDNSFDITLMITVVQGTILNIIVFIFMLLVYWIQRSFRRLPDEQLRAFEVIMPAAPVDVHKPQS